MRWSFSPWSCICCGKYVLGVVILDGGDPDAGCGEVNIDGSGPDEGGGEVILDGGEAMPGDEGFKIGSRRDSL